MFLSLSFSLPLSLKINFKKIFKNKNSNKIVRETSGGTAVQAREENNRESKQQEETFFGLSLEIRESILVLIIGTNM